MSAKEVDFSDLVVQEVPVTVGTEKFVLREASGAATVAYRNARMSRTVFNEQGKVVSINNIADLEPMLVASCLFTEDGKPVPEAKILSWPNRVLNALFEQAEKISGMNKPAEEDAESDIKN